MIDLRHNKRSISQWRVAGLIIVGVANGLMIISLGLLGTGSDRTGTSIDPCLPRLRATSVIRAMVTVWSWMTHPRRELKQGLWSLVMPCSASQPSHDEVE